MIEKNGSVTENINYEEVNVTSYSNVVQANYLIENKPKMSLDAHKLFLTLVATINYGDTELKNIKLNVRDIINLWEIDPKNAYRRVKSALDDLLNAEFVLETVRDDGRRHIQKTKYITEYSYIEGEGYANIQVSSMFTPFLIDLKKEFTMYVIKAGINMESVASLRTYELLKEFENLGSRTFDVATYKKLLGFTNNEYKGNNNNLKKRVLDPACKEISEKTHLFVRYDFKGRGEKAIIDFKIIKKENIKQEIPAAYAERPYFAVEEKKLLLDLLKNELNMGTHFKDKQLKEAIEMVTVSLSDPEQVLNKFKLLEECYKDFLYQMTMKDIKYTWAYFKKIILAKLE